jgi:hypothetical protein
VAWPSLGFGGQIWGVAWSRLGWGVAKFEVWRGQVWGVAWQSLGVAHGQV